MGIKKTLDGMFACTPKNGKAMYEALKNEDYALARVHLDNILLMRNTMLACDLMPSFSYCMHLIGCEGNFHQDYCLPLGEEAKSTLTETMKRIGEI